MFKHMRNYLSLTINDFIFMRNKVYPTENTVQMAEGVETIFVKLLVFSKDASPFVQMLALERQTLAGWGPHSFVFLQVHCWQPCQHVLPTDTFHMRDWTSGYEHRSTCQKFSH